MLTDAEVDALARDIVSEAIAYVNRLGNPPFSDVRKTNTGDPLIVYTATAEGYGEFTCEYAPLEPVKKIIRVCEGYYDTFPINAKDPKTGTTQTLPLSPIRRTHWVENMAANAALHLVLMFRTELWLTIEESLEDCYVIAAAYLASGVGKNLSLRAGEATGDARELIKKSAKRVADKKQNKLQLFMKNLPNLVIERGRGRIPKSQSERALERKEYSAKIEAVYRSRRLQEGKRPTKVSIAGELGEGGQNPKTGSDTRLNAFNRKLERLDINYDEIAEKVEAELHNNS